MGELAGHHSSTVQDLVDDMIRGAVHESFDTAGASLAPERAEYGSLPTDIERLAFGTRLGFFGAGGSGFLVLGCGASLVPDAASAAPGGPWIVERANVLGRRIEKRLRQFGISVRLEAPELLSDGDFGPVVQSPALRCSYSFGVGDEEVFVHLDGELDLERIANCGEVPLRDEGDIILF